MLHPTSPPVLLTADSQGKITEFPELEAVGMSNGHYHLPQPDDFIPLPEGSELFSLPGRLPVGWDPRENEPVLLDENPNRKGQPVRAVAAFMAPAYTSVFNCGYQTQPAAPTLPLFAYTAVGWHGGSFWVTAFRSDPDKRQDHSQYDQKTVVRKTGKKLKANRNNRLIQHLGKCCLTYGCPAARNYFLDRWEAPLPTSPECNARCIGCISLQPTGVCSATQDRITFVPTAREISDLAVPHLMQAENPIVSFGQGCEGEPLLQADVLQAAIVQIRSKTSRGTINLNSNSSLPDSIAKLAEAGLDSLRVSLNSVQEIYYTRYYRPKGYTFADVKQSIRIMKENNRFVSLNYFVLPGVTDSVEEFETLCRFITSCKPDLIQLRNLNMDPEWYLNILKFPKDSVSMGIHRWLQSLKESFPDLQFGYFNPQTVQPLSSE
ncbi:MAG: radical SAM protein [Deltaproteobacteria bacterium]|nr:radical SAM protein [Deltaproteobacteria bacterium]